MRYLLALALSALTCTAQAEARFVQTPYAPPKVVLDIYLDNPAKIGAALYWLRGILLTLSVPPYSYDPETIKVVLHGTEIVTLAKKNEDKYREAVERMRYYADMGIEFKVCSLALEDYGYRLQDLQDFVQAVPSAMTELIHWQNQGYALLTPQILDKKYSIEQIR
ncbi:MAG: DsrE family protein [Thiobacillaceae bacterium]|nr:DsrE family protein [Thiobacillaceae bacterium]MDW8323575.1 DsrE family protein [Burkholderiales bacterium]